MKVLYMVSISCQQKKHTVTIDNLKDVIRWLKHQIPYFKIQKHYYELGTMYKQLHIHMIVQLRKDFRWKAYTQYGDIHYMHNTYHIDYKRIYNHKKAIQYISKDECPITKYYSTHFFNITTQRFSVAV